MRIGILNAQGEIRNRFGLSYDVVDQIISLFSLVEIPLTFQEYMVCENQFPRDIRECDAYFVTGSPASVYDEHLWIRSLMNMVQECQDAQMKLMAGCFGHQLLAQALGGRTEKAKSGWGIGLLPFSIRDPFSGTSEVSHHYWYYSHQDQVQTLPSDAECFLWSEHCPYGGFTIGTTVLSFQGHPEFGLDYIEKLIEVLKPKLGEEVARRARESLGLNPVDTILAPRLIRDFLECRS